MRKDNSSLVHYLFISSGALLIIFSWQHISPLLFQHIIYYCSGVMNKFALPIPFYFPLFFIVSFGAALLYFCIGLIISFVQLLQVRKLLRISIQPPASIQEILHRYHLTAYTKVVESNKPFAFCFGLPFSTIYLSTGMIKLLTIQEIEVVLLHESYHRKKHHLLYRIFTLFAKLLMPFFPIVSILLAKQLTKQETEADAEAVAITGNYHALLSGLSKLLLVSSSPSFVIPSFGSFDTLEARIALLQNIKVKQKSWLFASVYSVLIMFFLLFFSLPPAHALIGKSTGMDFCNNSSTALPYFSILSEPVSHNYSAK